MTPLWTNVSVHVYSGFNSTDLQVQNPFFSSVFYLSFFSTSDTFSFLFLSPFCLLTVTALFPSHCCSPSSFRASFHASEGQAEKKLKSFWSSCASWRQLSCHFETRLQNDILPWTNRSSLVSVTLVLNEPKTWGGGRQNLWSRLWVWEAFKNSAHVVQRLCRSWTVRKLMVSDPKKGCRLDLLVWHYEWFRLTN